VFGGERREFDAELLRIANYWVTISVEIPFHSAPV